MSAAIALVVLTAALFHATWNALVKSGKDHLISLTGLNVATALIAIPMVPLVGIPELPSWPYLLASAVLHFAYYIALSEAYRYSDFSQAYPIARGTAPILVTLGGVFFLQEYMSTIEVISLIGVISGILIFVTRQFGQVAKDRYALIAALITSLTIGGYTLVDGVGGRLSGNIPAYMIWLSIFDGFPILIYTLFRRKPSEVIAVCADYKMLFAGAALALASYSMVVWSMSQASIPLVSALRETSIIFAALIGTFYFKERSGMRRMLASIIIFFSVALLALDGS